MSSKGFGQPLWIDTRQGWRFAWLLLCLGAISLFSVLLSDLNLALRLTLSLLVVGLLVGTWLDARHGRRLFVDERGGIHIQLAEDDRRACRLPGRPLSVFGLTFLIFIDETGARYPLVIEANRNPAGAIRRLLVAAHHGAFPTSAPVPSRLNNPTL